MANRIKILDISPLRFVPKTLTLDQKYHIKHFDEALHADQIRQWEEKRYYVQKFQTNDPLYWQIVSNFGPVSARLIDRSGAFVVGATVNAVSTSYYLSPEVCYGCSIDLSGVTPGGYQVEMIFGSGLTETRLISEVIYVAVDFPNTACFEYRNDANEQGSIHQNGESFLFRCEATIHSYQPASNDVSYVDEPANIVKLSSVPFDTFKLTIGDGFGVPDWLIKKVNKILGCDTVLIDGKQFAKAEGAKWDRKSEEGNPLNGWTIDIRPAKAREGLIIENNLPLDHDVIVISVGETDLFGPLGGTGTDANIIKVE